VGALNRTIDKANEALGQCLPCNAIIQSTEYLHSVTRSLLKTLRPPDLDELGLETALENLVSNWKMAHPEIDCSLIIRGDSRTHSESINFLYYRAVQEGLVNIVRHSRADQVSIELTFPINDQDRSSLLKLTDNGIGMLESDTHNGGLGLIGLRERVLAVGGTFTVQSHQPSGVYLIIQTGNTS